MGRIQTIAAGILLGVGLPISLIATFPLLDQHAPRNTKEGALGALILLGLPPVGLGSWLAISHWRNSQRQERDRLQVIFYRLLTEGSGHINTLRFSMESNLSGTEAKSYLDDRAREFNAAYNVSEEGKISYYFDGDFSSKKQIEEGEEKE
jgi:predicted transcriptional regulator